jgi:quinol monooxygenase YgiN
MMESVASMVSSGRRRVLQGLLALLCSAGFARSARAQTADVPLPIVRISRASFAPEKFEAIKNRLDEAQGSLVPAIRRLAGCQHYFAAIDRQSSTMVNVSVWRSLADAQKMQTLAPMLALAEDFTREGVRFERPIINYETVWTIS